MPAMLKNPEFKSVVIKLLAVVFIITLFYAIFVYFQLSSASEQISDQNIALVGKVLSSKATLELELPAILTKKATLEEIKVGKSLLDQYGYKKKLDAFNQPILNNLYSNINLLLAIFFLSSFFVIAFLLLYEYQKIFKKVRLLSNAAEKVIENDFNEALQVGEEGDFSILNHQFNQMTKRLKLSFEELKKEKLFLKDIISDISHQLKTPLSNLLMFNELILSSSNMLPAKRNEFLEKSKFQLEKMEWLIISLLKIARLEAGSIDFIRVKTSLKDTLHKALLKVDTSVMVHRQSINLQTASQDIFYFGDEEWTSEALANIIRNAVEHNTQSGNIEITISETSVFSKLSIKDHGEGIPEKDLPRIFDRFYRGKHSKKGSIGIGLSLSKLIIEGQGGTISVTSQPGIGSEFIITFLKGVI